MQFSERTRHQHALSAADRIFEDAKNRRQLREAREEETAPDVTTSGTTSTTASASTACTTGKGMKGLTGASEEETAPPVTTSSTASTTGKGMKGLSIDDLALIEASHIEGVVEVFGNMDEDGNLSLSSSEIRSQLSASGLGEVLLTQADANGDVPDSSLSRRLLITYDCIRGWADFFP